MQIESFVDSLLYSPDLAKWVAAVTVLVFWSPVPPWSRLISYWMPEHLIQSLCSSLSLLNAASEEQLTMPLGMTFPFQMAVVIRNLF